MFSGQVVLMHVPDPPASLVTPLNIKAAANHNH